MKDNYIKAVMLFAILPNMKILAEDTIRGNREFQITVGNKKNISGMYLQVKNGEVMVKQGIFEGKPDCRLHFFSVSSLSRFCLQRKGNPIIMGFYNPLYIFKFKSLLNKSIDMLLNKKYNDTDDDKTLIARMYFNTICNTINELGKSGNEVIENWLKDSQKKTYSFEIKDNKDVRIWITVQNGSSKVLLSQSTILTSQCSLIFNNIEEVIQFYNSDTATRNSLIDNIVVVREDQVNKSKEIEMLKTILEEAFKYLK